MMKRIISALLLLLLAINTSYAFVHFQNNIQLEKGLPANTGYVNAWYGANAGSVQLNPGQKLTLYNPVTIKDGTINLQGKTKTAPLPHNCRVSVNNDQTLIFQGAISKKDGAVLWCDVVG